MWHKKVNHVALLWDYSSVPLKSGLEGQILNRVWEWGIKQGDIVFALACADWQHQNSEITNLFDHKSFYLYPYSEESENAIGDLVDIAFEVNRVHNNVIWILVANDTAFISWVKNLQLIKCRVCLVGHRSRRNKQLVTLVDQFQPLRDWETSKYYPSHSQRSSLYVEAEQKRPHQVRLHTLRCLGTFFHNRRNFLKAKEIYQQLMNLCDARERASVQNNLGRLYEDQGDYIEAITQYQQALASSFYYKDHTSKEVILNNLRYILKSQGWNRDTLDHYVEFHTYTYVPQQRWQQSQKSKGSSLMGSNIVAQAIRTYIAPLLGLSVDNICFSNIKCALEAHPIYGKHPSVNERVKHLLESLNWALTLEEFWQGVYDA